MELRGGDVGHAHLLVCGMQDQVALEFGIESHGLDSRWGIAHRGPAALAASEELLHVVATLGFVNEGVVPPSMSLR